MIVHFIQYADDIKAVVVNLNFTSHAFFLVPPPLQLLINLSPPQLSPLSLSLSISLFLLKRRIIVLGMLTPTLTRDMLIRCNWPPFLIGTNFENHGRDDTHGKGADGCVAFPCYGCWPPSSCGGPYLWDVEPASSSHGDSIMLGLMIKR
mmetsp:Transcript_6730/g.10535  ORF Transcript_6730/g.10535 Transcript_6730/m.10535 type:complete len:149 (+) Transcript_6730:219-665(+)